MIRHSFLDLDITADVTTREFGVPGGKLTCIEHSAAGSSPTGTWTLERYNQASGAWETYDTGDASFTDPSSADAAGNINLQNLPPGKYRVKYTASGGGSATGGDVVIHIDDY